MKDRDVRHRRVDVLQHIGNELRDRATRWRRAALPIAQAALAAGLSWLVAVHAVGHPSPFFAPIAAVVSLGITLGQRLRRGAELVAGVAIGIGVGDLVMVSLGSGPWPIAFAVAVAMSAAVLVDGGAIITLQSAASAVLVAALSSSAEGSGVDRMVDALIGGSAGLLVAAALPGHPLEPARRHAVRVLGQLAGVLRDVARALETRDASRAAAVLERARTTQRLVDEFRAALQVSVEITTIAPLRWACRPALEPYLALVTPVDHAIRNTRVLARRAVATLRDGEAIPDGLGAILEHLADAVELLGTELVAGREPAAARRRMQAVAAAASPALIRDGAFSAMVVLAQLRSTVVDMLQAAGMSGDGALAALSPAAPRRARDDRG